MILIITKLAQDRIDGWRSKVGRTGLIVWERHFKGKSEEAIVDDVQWLLEGSDVSRNFYYRAIEEDPETGKVKRKNGVLSPVLGVYCNATAFDNQLGPLSFPANKPEGALTMTCQAVKRGLNYFRTGKLVIPTGVPGQFSKTNWADHMDHSEGVPTRVPSTSAIATVVNKLNDAQWTKIIEAAKAAALERDDTDTVIDVDAYCPEEDFELVDDDYDV
ncbi:hypothetical protein B0H19DRAFT_1043335 [Mycena capillaripes]|nr:hypothetical protein B0H19DRAFT_1008738 [Mycena capillaripes]KAJ6523209.1 hypothetical protein B0H19DRAFT_1043335 [Mycena capillaripes]